ncbi:hypothetical protein D0Z07_7546 [Hyphodiscus hymeniophilus]|uniref:Uncharacterized protein n=1 Tax=Hyphodiscus hymeniophilus TaxID=353542 RepID=A0A9P6VEX6_9HELO|nr:hypothetical protein D0Z07_7546 [Hyphodiscus hymeniophilus]
MQEFKSELSSVLTHRAPGSWEKANRKRKVFDFLREPHPEDLTSFQRFVVELDWSKSPLGPISTWPAQLHQMVLLVMQDPTPAVIYWGDEATIVYNESYTQLIGQKHPALQGQDPKIGFAEVWDHFEALLARQRETGETTIEANALLLLFRHGFFEETYFNWKFVPIIGPGGWVVGSHATVVEVTREVLSDRRQATVRNLSRQISEATTIRDLWAGIIQGLQDAERDIPLAMLYSVTSTTPVLSKSESATSSNIDRSSESPQPLTCFLEDSLGVPKGHLIAPAKLHAETDLASILPSMHQCMETMRPVVVAISSELQDGITWRGHGVPSNSFVVCPIIPKASQNVLAFLVIALNPYRPYDENYQGFIDIITQQVTTPQLSALLLREEVERGALVARQEAIDRDRLYKELSESESKFARFAQRAPIGLAILKPDGTALSANDLWRDLTLLQVGSNQVSWEGVLVNNEFDRVMSAWETLVKEKHSVTLQTKIRKPWKAPEFDRHGKEQVMDTHILLAMYPDLDEYGKVVSIMSWCVSSNIYFPF